MLLLTAGSTTEQLDFDIDSLEMELMLAVTWENVSELREIYSRFMQCIPNFDLVANMGSIGNRTFSCTRTLTARAKCQGSFVSSRTKTPSS